MNTSVFMLVFYVMTSSGQLGVIHEGSPEPLRLTGEQCATTMKERLLAEKKKPSFVWVGAECIAVPPVPSDRPSAPVIPTPDLNNPRELGNT